VEISSHEAADGQLPEPHDFENGARARIPQSRPDPDDQSDFSLSWNVVAAFHSSRRLDDAPLPGDGTGRTLPRPREDGRRIRLLRGGGAITLSCAKGDCGSLDLFEAAEDLGKARR
jgi:hypothetical protein